MWNWIRKGWCTLLVRTALFVAFWLLLAFVVAAEFYLTGLNGPAKTSWAQAAIRPLRDWFPWMLISPLVVVLAELFRFDRHTWQRSLLVHLAACILVAVAYESLLTWTLPKPEIRVFRAANAPVLETALQVGVGGSLTNSPPLTNSGVATFGSIRMFNFGDVNSADNVQISPTNELNEHSTATVWDISNYTARTAVPEIQIQIVTNINSTMTGSWEIVDASDAFQVFTPTVGPINTSFSFYPMTSVWRGLLHRAAMRTQLSAPIYWFIVCVCWILNHFQESIARERSALELEKRLSQANLQALKMQLQPHFLFNTLNAISSLVHENPWAADDMIGSLSQFLRMNLAVSSQNEVPLSRELYFIDHYLGIQQKRFGERLHVHRSIDPAVRDAMVPTLILQPLVENAIRHGIESREIGGTVAIRAIRVEDMLRLEIADDGEGFKDDKLPIAIEGIGLSNTRSRLNELYGDRYRFRIASNQPTGACFTIEIPYRINNDETELLK